MCTPCRYCLGAALAMAEMKCFVALLARSYSFTADNDTEWKARLGVLPRQRPPPGAHSQQQCLIDQLGECWCVSCNWLLTGRNNFLEGCSKVLIVLLDALLANIHCSCGGGCVGYNTTLLAPLVTACVVMLQCLVAPLLDLFAPLLHTAVFPSTTLFGVLVVDTACGDLLRAHCRATQRQLSLCCPAQGRPCNSGPSAKCLLYCLYALLWLCVVHTISSLDTHAAHAFVLAQNSAAHSCINQAHPTRVVARLTCVE